MLSESNRGFEFINGWGLEMSFRRKKGSTQGKHQMLLCYYVFGLLKFTVKYEVRALKLKMKENHSNFLPSSSELLRYVYNFNTTRSFPSTENLFSMGQNLGNPGRK